ncbi:MAG: T9SS type A sorting domain-containing protein [Flavobacteriales bacterium]|nr:T9SS type A sorting domain-containing protein [Flavobacteriales bacterium]
MWKQKNKAFSKRFFLRQFILLFLLSYAGIGHLNSQVITLKDTVKFMTYNLLNYGNTTTYCTTGNNNIATKDQHLKVIIQHVQPDILVVNEMGCNTVYGRRILTNCMNIGTFKYKSGTMFASTGQDLCNLIFYNSELFELVDQKEINKNAANQSMIRSAGDYRLYYKSPGLSEHKDSSTLRVITTHLKAGNGSSESMTRGLEAEIIMETVSANPSNANYILAGDLNLYRSSETAWSNFTNYTQAEFNFKDPINQIGSWTSNSSYAKYHTQSTTTSSNGCQSGGGMDDRFDFILASTSVMNGSNKVKILPETYQALGQDGNRYNQSIDNPTNTSVPSAVVLALATLSDHLPVVTDLEITYSSETKDTSTSISALTTSPIIIINPSHALTISGLAENVHIELIDLSGQVVHSGVYSADKNIGSNLPKGIYLLRFENNKTQETYKWVKE